MIIPPTPTSKRTPKKPTQIRVKCIPVIPAFVIDMLYNVSQKAKQFLWNSHLAVYI